MSFILDALKKIEEEKRIKEGEPVEETIRLQKARAGRRRQAFRVGTIAVLSAGVTLLGLNLFERLRGAPSAPGAAPDQAVVSELSPTPSDGNHGGGDPEPVETASAPAIEYAPDPKPVEPSDIAAAAPTTDGVPSASDDAPPTPVEMDVDEDVVEPEEDPGPSPPMRVVGLESPRRAAAVLRDEPASAPVADADADANEDPEPAQVTETAPEAPEPEPEVKPEPTPEPEMEPAPEPEVETEPDTATEESSDSVAPPEAPLPEREAPVPEPEREAPEPETEAPVPEPETTAEPGEPVFPDLVLQGTSVIDGRPVAVVNEQRVFEGDWIEGARVVKIEERAVVLVLNGKEVRLEL